MLRVQAAESWKQFLRVSYGVVGSTENASPARKIVDNGRADDGGTPGQVIPSAGQNLDGPAFFRHVCPTCQGACSTLTGSQGPIQPWAHVLNVLRVMAELHCVVSRGFGPNLCLTC